MPIYVQTLRNEAEKFKKTLECKSGLRHIKETRIWQKHAIDEFVEQIIKKYETGPIK